MRIQWQGEELDLLPEKAIFWNRQKTLFLADPHFGKAASFRKAGIPVSEASSENDLFNLSFLIRQTNARTIVFLGDFFHARTSRANLVKKMLSDWRCRFPSLELHLIRGNHDYKSGDPWEELKIQCHNEPFVLNEWECRHHPLINPSNPYLAGHLHPGYSLQGKGRPRVRSACFQVGRMRIILPAFGSFTGLQNVKLESHDQIFMTDGKNLMKIPCSLNSSSD